MTIYLVTERLVLRRLCPDDADNLLALDNDPMVMRYINDAAPVSRKEIVEVFLPRMLGYYDRTDRYGYWAAELKSTGEFIGWFHFRPDFTNPDDIELGYRLKQSAWGHGYATEGSMALIRRGFVEFNLTRITASTLAVNGASRRVMEKAGLHLVESYREERFPGEDKSAVRYAIERAEFERNYSYRPLEDSPPV